jgi:septal ring factor EnvC (AmiA/AmiB activator)
LKAVRSGYSRSLSVFSDSVMDVKSCMAGTVTSIFDIDGATAVFTTCGDYYFCYSNLDTVFVKKGDALCSQQLIGRVGTTNSYQLYELELALLDRKGQQIDPYPLLRKITIRQNLLKK